MLPHSDEFTVENQATFFNCNLIGKDNMTGYTVHTGTSKKFSNGWDRIFGGQEQTGGKKQRAEKAGKGKKNSQTEAVPAAGKAVAKSTDKPAGKAKKAKSKKAKA